MNLSRVEIAVYFGRRRKKNRKREREPSNILAGGGRISCRNHALKLSKIVSKGEMTYNFFSLFLSLSRQLLKEREREREERERNGYRAPQ